MSEFTISTRYANALMSIADEKNIFDVTLDNIKLIKETLDTSKDLRNFLNSPIIKSADKAQALKNIFVEYISGDVSNFLSFLVQKGRENLLIDICKRFISLSNEKLNQVDVKISSAVELTQAQRDEITIKLGTIINKKVIPSFEIENEMIGGFKANFGDTVIDASIKHQLEKLKKQLFQDSYLKN